MPSRSKAQRKFFGIIHGLQSGKIHPSKVSSSMRKAAKSISPKDVKDFVSTSEKGLPLKVKKEIISVLKEIAEPMYLNEVESNPVAKTFNQKGKYEDYIKRFIGIRLSPKELESLNTYKEAKPNKIEPTQIRYENTDGFGGSITTTIKKLKDGSQFAFTAFTKFSKTEQNKEQPEPGQPTQQELDNIVVTKSASFEDEIKGAYILVEFLKKIDL